MRFNIFLALVIIAFLFSGLSCNTAGPGTTTPPGETTPSGTTSPPVTTTTPPTTTEIDRYKEWNFHSLSVTPSEVEVGGRVVVSVWVNVYGAIGEPIAQAILAIDGQVVATKDVLLEADTSEQISFAVVADELGTHEVRVRVMLPEEGPYKVGEYDLSARFTVVPPTTSPTAVSFVVEINGSAFIPPTITVPVGATVTWVHRDRQEDLAWWWHSVTSETGLFASSQLYYGDTFSYTFTEPGTYHYYDKNITYMRGTVIVE